MPLPPSIALFRQPRDTLDLGRVRLGPRRLLALSLGIGSGLFQGPGDHPSEFWCVTDRGPNFKCSSAPGRLGRSVDEACRGLRHGKIFPMPAFAPAIVRIRLGGDSFAVLDNIPLRDPAGRPLTGLPTPSGPALDSEPGFDLQGEPLSPDPDGLDPEGIVRLSDGSFWIGEEFGPSLLQVATDGRVRRRLVPAGSAAIFTGSRIPVVDCLPALLARRALNRGIEGIGLSADEATLWFMVQSPLANPDFSSFERSRIVRLYALRVADLTLVSEYAYVLDAPGTFAAERSDRPSDVRIGDLVALPDQRLLVLERIDATTKVYAVDAEAASNLAGTTWDRPDRISALEALQPGELAAASVQELNKQLVFDSAAIDGFPHAMEGLSLSADGRTLTLISDNDFGIDGDETVVARIAFPAGITFSG